LRPDWPPAGGTVLALLKHVFQDLRLGFRFLRRQWGFTAGAVALLGLGICFSTTLFAIVQGALLEPWPYAGYDRMVTVGGNYPVLGRSDSPLWSAPEIEDLRQSGVFEAVIAGNARNVNLTYQGRPERVRAALLTPNAFPKLGLPALLGRTLVTSDALPGATPVVVVSYTFWRDRLGADPHIVGQMLRLSDAAYSIVGVMPEPFVFWDEELWMPQGLDPTAARTNRTLYVQAWLRKGEGLPQAQARLDILARRLHADHPDVPEYAGFRVNLRLLREEVLRDLRPTLYVLLMAAALVLAVATANMATAMLAKGVSREGEMAIRLAIGASGPRLGRQLIVESLMIGCGGGLVGVLGAKALLPVLVGQIPYGYVPAEAHVALNGQVLLVAVFGSILAGAFLGVVPAVRVWHGRAGVVLKRALTRTGSRVISRWQNGFIVFQIMLAMVVLATAIALAHGMSRWLQRDVGWRVDDVWTVRVALSSPDVAAQSGEATYVALLDRIHAIPGVTDVAASSALPIGNMPTMLVSGKTDSLAGRSDALEADAIAVTPSFFRVLGIPIRMGRSFVDSDRPGSQLVSIVSRGLAAHLWPDGRALGSTLRAGDRLTTVVGITEDVIADPTLPGARPAVFMPVSQQPPTSVILSLKATDTTRLAASVRDAVSSVDASLPVFGADPLSRLRDAALGPERLAALLLLFFGLTTLVLSAIGIYSVISHSVGERRQEISIRLTLGATRGHVFSREVRRGLTIVGFSAPLALATAIAAQRALGSALFIVQANTAAPAVLGVVTVALFTLTATSVPAWRAVSRALIRPLRNLD
jgi:predicted permease